MEQNINVNDEMNELVVEETTSSGKGGKVLVAIAAIGLAGYGIGRLIKRIKAKKTAKKESAESNWNEEDDIKVHFTEDENGHLVSEDNR